ncbi:MAG TPA: APC family permease [Acholeplasma sp.]|nr:APC family permease [Acholeplasma sp.]
MRVPTKKFGVFTAIAMVVGIVIGSGVFKSAGDVLAKAGGSMPIAILAWLIGGAIIIFSSLAFSIVALKNADKSGIIGFVEGVVGEKTAYLVSWYINLIYFPILVGVLSWLAGSITNSLVGFDSDLTWVFTIIYFIGSYALNVFSPVMAGRFQVSTTVIKLLPLGLIAVVGIIVGLINQTTIESFTTNAVITSTAGTGLAAAVAITAFAYDGWITALSITQELRDPKKNLAKALVGGSLIIVLFYILFFIGLSGVITNDEAVSLAGSLNTSILAAKRLFGSFFGPVLSVLILVSVLGTLNGLTLAAVRGMYQISVKGIGPAPKLFTTLGKKDQPYASGLISFILTFLWGIVWFGNFKGYWGGFIDTSVLSIVFLYASFILVYYNIVKNFTELNLFKRYFVPLLATAGALYLIYGAFVSSPKMFLYFCLMVLPVLLIGSFSYKPKRKVSLETKK